jgi:hypothetical protein
MKIVFEHEVLGHDDGSGMGCSFIEVRCFMAGSLIGFTAMPKRPSDQLAITGVRSGYHNATEAGYKSQTRRCIAFQHMHFCFLQLSRSPSAIFEIATMLRNSALQTRVRYIETPFTYLRRHVHVRHTAVHLNVGAA